MNHLKHFLFTCQSLFNQQLLQADVRWERATVRKPLNNNTRCISRNWAGVWLAVNGEEEVGSGLCTAAVATFLQANTCSDARRWAHRAGAEGSASLCFLCAERLKAVKWWHENQQHREGNQWFEFNTCPEGLNFSFPIRRYMVQHWPTSPQGLCCWVCERWRKLWVICVRMRKCFQTTAETKRLNQFSLWVMERINLTSLIWNIWGFISGSKLSTPSTHELLGENSPALPETSDFLQSVKIKSFVSFFSDDVCLI